MGRAKTSKLVAQAPMRINRLIAIPEKYDLNHYNTVVEKYLKNVTNLFNPLYIAVQELTGSSLEEYRSLHFAWLYGYYSNITALPSVLLLHDNPELRLQFNLSAEKSFPSSQSDKMKSILSNLKQLDTSQTLEVAQSTNWLVSKPMPYASRTISKNEPTLNHYRNKLAEAVLKDEEYLVSLKDLGGDAYEDFITYDLRNQILSDKVTELSQLAIKIINS